MALVIFTHWPVTAQTLPPNINSDSELLRQQERESQLRRQQESRPAVKLPSPTPLCEPQEPDYSKLSQVNGCDEHQMRTVIRSFIKAYYDSFDEQSWKVIADTI